MLPPVTSHHAAALAAHCSCCPLLMLPTTHAAHCSCCRCERGWPGASVPAASAPQHAAAAGGAAAGGAARQLLAVWAAGQQRVQRILRQVGGRARNTVSCGTCCHIIALGAATSSLCAAHHRTTASIATKAGALSTSSLQDTCAACLPAVAHS
jgi:hypothetical protein